MSGKKSCAQVRESWKSTLRITASAIDEKDIKKAWKKAAMAAHPDRGGKHTDMVKVNQAYDDAISWYKYGHEIPENNYSDQNTYSQQSQRTQNENNSRRGYRAYADQQQKKQENRQTQHTNSNYQRTEDTTAWTEWTNYNWWVDASKKQEAERLKGVNLKEVDKIKRRWTYYKWLLVPVVIIYFMFIPIYETNLVIALFAFAGLIKFGKKYVEARLNWLVVSKNRG